MANLNPGIEQFVFKDDGTFPNSCLPLLVYRQPLDRSELDLATLFETRFSENGWTNSWRDGVFDFAHYHSTSHEVLAVYSGEALLQLGGPISGSHFTFREGDVIVIPAGVCHQQLSANQQFGVVGAYPDGRDWDVLRGASSDRPAADARIAALPLPNQDPLFGKDGPLMHAWSANSD